MTGQLALITGGNRGLGRSAALHLARGGVDTVLTYRGHKQEAEAVAADIAALGRKAVALQLDTTEVGSFAAFAETIAGLLKDEWGRDSMDFLVNNAGFGLHKSFAETTEEEFDALMAVHLKGVFFLTQKMLPLIADGGRILNLSSGLARFSLPGYSAYAAMKGGVEVLSRYLAAELAPRKIAVNVIAPGAIATDFGGSAVRDNEHVNKRIAAATAMGRVGVPDDIGQAVAAILTADSQWMTGQRIEVSGGQSL